MLQDNSKLAKLYLKTKYADPTRCSSKSIKSTKHRKEFMRAFFGETEEQAMDAIQDLLFNLLGINSEYVELEWGRFKDSSGDYDSCKVFAKEPVVNKLYNLFIPKGSYVYIVNTSKGASKILRKTLTPDSLGITTKAYTSLSDLKSAVLKGINDNGLDTYKDAIKALMNAILQEPKYLSIEELLGNPIVYELDKNEISPLDEREFKNVCNDFGEVLGAMCIMNSLYGDTTLAYPKGSNAKLYDYIINDAIKVSAKAGERGAVPSAVDTMKQIQDLVDKGLIDIAQCNSGEVEYLTQIVPIIADDFKGSAGSSIRRQTWRLALQIAKQKYKPIVKGLAILRRYGLHITENGISTQDIDKVQKKYGIESLLKELYDALEYTASKKYPIEGIDSIWKDYDPNTKEGVILYPLKVCITKYLNFKYDLPITKFANMVLTGYQMYLVPKTIGNTLQLSFNLKQMDKCEFKLSAQGSVGAPLLKSMGIVMVH